MTATIEDPHVEQLARLCPAEAVTFDLTPFWENTWQLRATAGRTVFSCLVSRSSRNSAVLQNCLPQRQSREVQALLPQAARWVAEALSVTDVVALHPADWDEHLAAHAARPLQRVVPMGLLLNDDHLRLHARPLPDGHAVTQLRGSVRQPAELAVLSIDNRCEGDVTVWRDVLAGQFGPVIDDASLLLVKGPTMHAAIAVTEYQGIPLIGHFVTRPQDRGQGLGRALLVESLRRLTRAGYNECSLNVVEDNWIAHRLYRSLGFIQSRPTMRASLLVGGGAGGVA